LLPPSRRKSKPADKRDAAVRSDADGGTRTPTAKGHQLLRLARLPVPPHPRGTASLGVTATLSRPKGQWPNWLRHRSPKPGIPGSSPGCPAPTITCGFAPPILKKGGYPSLWRRPIRGTLPAWEWICDASTVERRLFRRCSGGGLANMAAPGAGGIWCLPMRPMTAVTEWTDVEDGS
jgi:hypothetical protein